MHVSLEWLGDFVQVPAATELRAILERTGIEVESVEDPRERSTGVVVGEVLECTKHPKADKLNVCTVGDGSATFTVVCGAQNVALGQRIAFARPGAAFFSDEGSFKIEKRKLRGIESTGMIASREEMGLEEKSEGIWVLPKDTPLGEDVLDTLNILPTFSLGITPNRPDLLSHMGVAREIAAATGQRLKTQNWRLSEKGRDATSMVRVMVEEPQRCPRYIARVVSGLQIGPSPDWLKQRLAVVGQRSLNNVVDVTNYVLLEMGQPLHAFDLSMLALDANLPTIRVRCATEGEVLETLEGVERTLDTDDLVIADPKRALALAGVMGGANSEVSERTTDILIESAYFSPAGVRRSARRHGLHTEASHRFERGADPAGPLRAADRCAQLVAEIAGGNVSKSYVEAAQGVPGPIEVQLRTARVPKVLGIEVDTERLVQLLDPLDIKCVRRTDETARFAIPSFRPDLTREIDLVEEVARRVGFDDIPDRLPSGATEFKPTPKERSFVEMARHSLLAAGCTEVVTFGFGSPGAFSPHSARHGKPVRLLNPLGEAMSAMRNTLLPNMLQVVAHNQRQGLRNLRIFEIGKVFSEHEGVRDCDDERDRDLPQEAWRAGVLLSGGRYDGRWYEAGARCDFFDLRGVVEELLEVYGLKTGVSFRRADIYAMHPHACAEVLIGDQNIGYAAQLHPEFIEAGEDLEGPIFFAEIDLEPLGAAEMRSVHHAVLPRFPKTRRDVALLLDREVGAAQIQAYLKAEGGGKLGPEVVENVDVFDVYSGENIPEGKVSLAFSIEYRAIDRTLKDEEVTPAFDQVLEGLQQRFGAEIR